MSNISNAKIIRVTLAPLLFCLLFFSRCSDETCPGDENAIVESIDFLTINTQYAWVQHVDPNKSIVNVVIKSQQDYEKYVGISGDIFRPAIDFSKYTLLAGRIITPQCSLVAGQVVLDRCGTYTFEVTIERKDCHAFTTTNYFVVIHKTDHRIGFDITN